MSDVEKKKSTAAQRIYGAGVFEGLTLAAPNRELLERALDELYDAMMEGDDISSAQLLRATNLYVQAIALVRERPAGARKVRSDFMGKRKTPQVEFQV